MTHRLQNSDIIIYLDYSSFAQVKGIMGRYLKNHGKEKEEIPGCKEQMSLEFFFWAWNWRRDKRNEIIQKIKAIDENKLIIFKNRRQLNRWYKKEFSKKIIY